MVSLRPLALLLFVSVVTPVPQKESIGGGSVQCKQECPKIYLPLCGSDNKTYNNRCLLDLASCQNLNRNTPAITVIKEDVCTDDTDDICHKTCDETYNPVCGTDRVTYFSKCDLSIAICQGDEVRFHHEGTCAGFSGRGARRPSVERSHSTSSATSSSILNRDCPDTCTGGFRPVCGTNNITYGSDCHLQVAMCKNPTLRKKADGVCAKDCFLQCDSARELVCGTDHVTYTNDCFLLRARCKDPAVRKDHEGPCEFVEKDECRSRRCGTRGQAMCGSDGITYRNRCLFDAAVCYNQGLLKLYDGPCKPDRRLCGQCEDNTARFACGSDRVTYLNHCHLILHACLSGQDIIKVSEGPCLKRRRRLRQRIEALFVGEEK